MAEAVAAALEKQKRRNAALSDENVSLQEAVALIAAGQKEVSVRVRASVLRKRTRFSLSLHAHALAARA
jgi:hypothetical protein